MIVKAAIFKKYFAVKTLKRYIIHIYYYILFIIEISVCFKGHFHCINISYPVDNCISPARSRSRQILEKNVLSWSLTGTSRVVSIRQVSSQHPASLLRVCSMCTSSFCLVRKCFKFYTRNFSDIFSVLLPYLCLFVDIL